LECSVRLVRVINDACQMRGAVGQAASIGIVGCATVQLQRRWQFAVRAMWARQKRPRADGNGR
jgi:hypothetical protein